MINSLLKKLSNFAKIAITVCCLLFLFSIVVRDFDYIQIITLRLVDASGVGSMFVKFIIQDFSLALLILLVAVFMLFNKDQLVKVLVILTIAAWSYSIVQSVIYYLFDAIYTPNLVNFHYYFGFFYTLCTILVILLLIVDRLVKPSFTKTAIPAILLLATLVFFVYGATMIVISIVGGRVTIDFIGEVILYLIAFPYTLFGYLYFYYPKTN